MQPRMVLSSLCVWEWPSSFSVPLDTGMTGMHHHVWVYAVLELVHATWTLFQTSYRSRSSPLTFKQRKMPSLCSLSTSVALNCHHHFSRGFLPTISQMLLFHLLCSVFSLLDFKHLPSPTLCTHLPALIYPCPSTLTCTVTMIILLQRQQHQSSHWRQLRTKGQTKMLFAFLSYHNFH